MEALENFWAFPPWERGEAHLRCKKCLGRAWGEYVPTDQGPKVALVCPRCRRIQVGRGEGTGDAWCFIPEAAEEPQFELGELDQTTLFVVQSRPDYTHQEFIVSVYFTPVPFDRKLRIKQFSLEEKLSLAGIELLRPRGRRPSQERRLLRWSYSSHLHASGDPRKALTAAIESVHRVFGYEYDRKTARSACADIRAEWGKQAHGKSGI